MSKELVAELAYLRDADRQWNTIFDCLGSAVWLMDAEMRVIYANPATRELLGVEPAAIIGRRCWELVHGTSAPIESCPVVRAAGSRRNESGEQRIGERWLQISATPLLDDSGRVTGFVHRADDVTDRVVAQENLRRSEESFRRMLADTGTGFVVIDERGLVRDANQPYADMAGAASPAEIVGRSVIEWTAPDQREANAAAVALCARQGYIKDFETTYLRPDGTLVRVVVTSNARMVNGERLLYSYIADVTAREHAAAEARALLKATRFVVEESEFEAVARRVFDTCRQVIGADAGYVSSIDADGALERAVLIETGAQASGVDLELPFVVRGLRADAYRSGKSIIHNEFRRSETRALLPPGHIALQNLLLAAVRAGGPPVGVLGLANKPGGFTKRDARLAEAFGELLAIAYARARERTRLAESETRYRLLAENVGDVIWTADLELRFTFISPSHERMSGYSVAESIGRSALAILTPASVKLVAEVLREELDREVRGGADPRRTRRLELEQVNKDGRTIWTEVEASFLRDEAGRAVGLLGVSRDITEKRRMQASLAQADRLANMGMLAAGVAHEINNPLSFLIHNLESLVLDLAGSSGSAAGAAHSLPADAGERLREALSGADRIKAIVRGLGTFTRLERAEVTPTDVRQPVEHAVSMARNEIRYRARLVAELGVTPPVLGSEGKIAQVVLNLLMNAAQAIDEGDVANNEIRVRTWVADGDVHIEVTDTGKGITAEDLPLVFEPFFSTKPIGVGSGLGLPICRKIVEDFGGRIDLESEAGSGTRVVIRLPVHRTETRRDSIPGSAPSSAPPETRGRILVVDDEPGIRRMIERILGRRHEIVPADGGEAAQRILSADTAFDVLFFDVMMPLVTGIDLHAWLRARNPQLADRVVFFTGGAFTPRASDYLGKTGNLKIEKTMEAARLRALVAELVRRARGGTI